MNLKAKKALTKIVTALFAVLFVIGAALIIYVNSPLYPANISDEVIIEKGTEYTVKLSGVSEYDENGFRPVTDGFYFTKEKLFVYVDDAGYVRTGYEGEGEDYVLGRFNSPDLSYEKYDFCGESFKNKQELQSFFDSADPIYNFDINNLSYYISDIINYKKHFSGTATLKLYKGRFVITSVSIGDEKLLEIKR